MGHGRKRRTLHILMDNLIVQLGFLNIKKKGLQAVCSYMVLFGKEQDIYCSVTDVI